MKDELAFDFLFCMWSRETELEEELGQTFRFHWKERVRKLSKRNWIKKGSSSINRKKPKPKSENPIEHIMNPFYETKSWKPCLNIHTYSYLGNTKHNETTLVTAHFKLTRPSSIFSFNFFGKCNLLLITVT